MSSARSALPQRFAGWQRILVMDQAMRENLEQLTAHSLIAGIKETIVVFTGVLYQIIELTIRLPGKNNQLIAVRAQRLDVYPTVVRIIGRDRRVPDGRRGRCIVRLILEDHFLRDSLDPVGNWLDRKSVV